MSVKSSGSHDGPPPSNGDVIRSGVLKKMKTARKKFFVLRAETNEALARLEYYDSEKKYKNGLPPKRCIPLKTCFDINKRQDTKHKHVIALYTKDDCFCIVLDNEEELQVWLKDLLTLQHGEEIPEGEVLRPKFGELFRCYHCSRELRIPKYVWEVNLCARGLGASRTGTYRLCLTDKTVTLVKIDVPIPTVLELPLSSVRSCGNLKNFFFLEVGRSCNLGAGEFWFEADDTTIASNLQNTVSHRFKLIREKEKLANSTEATDIQPTSRTRSSSATESTKSTNKKFNTLTQKGSSVLPPDGTTSESNVTSPVTTTTTSTTGAGSGWSGAANHQRTQSLPLATPIATTCTVAPLTDNILTNATALTNHQHSSKRFTQGGQSSGKCSFRERCDSMPSRPRAISETNHAVPGWGKPYLLPHRYHFRDPSHSPPTGSPISPPSDSTGSSYSLPDEHDGLHEIIAEEECPDSPRANLPGGNYVPMNFQSPPENNYMDMNLAPQASGNQNVTSNSASMSSVTSGTPSTDIKFTDYPLDKVPSYVFADDDDARPYRAYSVGSKPPESNSQLASTPENSRVRAFSVGSKTKKYFNRVLPHHNHTPGVKSSSAPLLAPNSRTNSSHGSINNPMDDLMEMDFSSTTTSRSRSSTNASGSSDARSSCNHRNSNHSSNRLMGFVFDFLTGGGDQNKKTATPEGYMDMRPGSRTHSGSETSPYVDMNLGQRNSAYMDMTPNNVPVVGHAYAAYMDMTPNNVPTVGHAYSPYVDMSGNNSNTPHIGNGFSPYMDMSGNNSTRENYMDMSGSSPARNSPRNTMPLAEYARLFGRANLPENHRTNDYVDMNQTRRRANSNSSSSRAVSSPGFWNNTADHNADYLDMSGRNRRPDRTSSFSSQMSSSPQLETAPQRYLEAESQPSSHNIDGYVRMIPGNIQHHRQSSLDSCVDPHGDYLNMSGAHLSGAKNADAGKGRSQPISIHTTSNNQGVKNSSPLSITSLLGGKLSPTSTTSKMHLPLSSYSSLPRQKSPRKAATNGSKSNSSTSSSVTTTPSSSSTMFPLSLNSPSSPASTSKAGTPSFSGVKVPVSILSVPYKASSKKRPDEDAYAMMDFETNSQPLEASKVDESPYMNYCPPGANAPKAPVTLVSPCVDTVGDYAIMKPGTLPTKSTTLPRTKTGTGSGSASPLSMHLSTVALTDRQNLGFRPIREKDERIQSPRPGDQVPDRLRLDDRVLEEANMDVEDDSRRSVSGSVSPAAKISRPNSSNSENIKTPLQRPASISGSEKNSRPPSVCSEGLASRLGSNSSVYSSSSSASTVVGVPTLADLARIDQAHPVRLHYASLDLTNPDPEDRKSPRTVRNDSAAPSNETTFVYADIDFIKSEELSKNNSGNVASTSTTVKN
ncbi:insulin receptor substrate 1 isoform X3 [Sitophilus oryzae]|uniref:Insulin receptor substrate 1 n=1 Tax=Sitophilus oryzae TaxID=7048 RepID=A0A6J2XK88_SITOR|nr:insulin receptor substrate 1 isoform X3 [Sitophilus oryzae]